MPSDVYGYWYFGPEQTASVGYVDADPPLLERGRRAIVDGVLLRDDEQRRLGLPGDRRQIGAIVRPELVQLSGVAGVARVALAMGDGDGADAVGLALGLSGTRDGLRLDQRRLIGAAPHVILDLRSALDQVAEALPVFADFAVHADVVGTARSLHQRRDLVRHRRVGRLTRDVGGPGARIARRRAPDRLDRAAPSRGSRSLGSTGQAALPVDSFRFWNGCVVGARSSGGSTARRARLSDGQALPGADDARPVPGDVDRRFSAGAPAAAVSSAAHARVVSGAAAVGDFGEREVDTFGAGAAGSEQQCQRVRGTRRSLHAAQARQSRSGPQAPLDVVSLVELPTSPACQRPQRAERRPLPDCLIALDPSIVRACQHLLTSQRCAARWS